MLNLKNNKGFTFRELLICLVICSSLLAVGVPSVHAISKWLDSKQCNKNQEELYDKVTDYMVGNYDSDYHFGWEPGELIPGSQQWDTWGHYQNEEFYYYDELIGKETKMPAGEYFFKLAYNGQPLPSTGDGCNLGIRFVETKLTDKYEVDLQKQLATVPEDDSVDRSRMTNENHDKLYRDYQQKKSTLDSDYVPEGYIEIYCTNPDHNHNNYRIPVSVSKRLVFK